MPGERVANNLSEFLSIVAEISRRWFVKEKGWGPWFRGHPDADWALTPTLYRDAAPTRGIRVVEDEIRQEFIIRAPSLSAERPSNAWEWYFLMQHCGTPTRLLDWTEGALIALYFAVRNKLDKADAAVWVLNPWDLNKSVLGIEEVIAPSAEGFVRLGREALRPMAARSLSVQEVAGEAACRDLSNTLCEKDQLATLLLYCARLGP